MKNKKKSEGLSGFIRKHKRLTVILSAALVLIITAVILLIVLLPSDSDDRPSYNPITDGENFVTYYYSLPGGDMILVLYEGWTFSLDGPQYNKSGEYNYKDGVITLDFLFDKDGEATATPAKNKLTLTQDGKVFTYREKINFTVSFNTNGGGKAEDLEVLNGKTATEPQAPSKSGFDFAGWYTDSACTKAFDFATTLITENVTLYAKWLQTGSAD